MKGTVKGWKNRRKEGKDAGGRRGEREGGGQV